MERFEYEPHSPVAPVQDLRSSNLNVLNLSTGVPRTGGSITAWRHKEDNWQVLEPGEKSEKTSQFQNLSIKAIVVLPSLQSDANVPKGHPHQPRIHILVLWRTTAWSDQKLHGEEKEVEQRIRILNISCKGQRDVGYRKGSCWWKYSFWSTWPGAKWTKGIWPRAHWCKEPVWSCCL